MKKFNLAIITLLLVFQTVLSPISVLAAEGDPVLPVANTDTGDTDSSTAEETQPANEAEPTEPTEPTTETEVEDSSDTGTESTEPSPPIDEDVGDDSEPVISDSEGNTDAGEGTDAETNELGEVTAPEEDDLTLDEPEVAPLNIVYDPIMPESVITKVDFNVNGQAASPNAAIDVKNGDVATFHIDLELAAGHNYGPGTTLTYTLPSIFQNITFPAGTQFGELGEISKSGNDIIITFNENITSLGGGLAFEPGAYFEVSAEFDRNNTQWVETISVPGNENITLNFQPQQGTGTTVNKTYVRDNDGNNSKYVDWTVIVNTDAGTQGAQNFVDTLTGKHTFATDSVTIAPIAITPAGVGSPGTHIPVTPTFSPDNKVMTVTLPETTHTGYEIKYRTIVGDPGNVSSTNLRNTASYNGRTAPQTATINFGTPLNKTHTGPTVSDLKTYWTIEYNFNNRDIDASNAVLEDTWTDTQELVGGVGGIVVEDQDGNAFGGYTVTLNGDGDGFILTFKNDVTEPYTIKYATQPRSGVYPIATYTVENKVQRPDMADPVIDRAQYRQNTLLLEKTTPSIDYANKTISWRIEANQAGYALDSGTVFEDTFTDENLTLLEDSLVVRVGSVTLVRGTDYTLNNPNDKTGFTITLTDATNQPIRIEYDTAYDIKEFGANNNEYNNEVEMTNSALANSSIDTAERSIDDKQKANGVKSGEYDYATKTFYWDVELNFNYNSLTDAVFEDKLPDTQRVESITVQEGSLNAQGVFQPETTKNIPNTATAPNEIQLKLGHITKPHKVSYTSVDADGLFEHGSLITITNHAELTSDGGSTPNANWEKTIAVGQTNDILEKTGNPILNTARVKWDFKFNYAQSRLENVVITDTVAKNPTNGAPDHIILADTFKVYEVALSGKTSSASTPTAPTETKTLVNESEYGLSIDNESGTFTLTLGDVEKAYFVEYETLFTGGRDYQTNNLVEVTYNNGTQRSGNDLSSGFTVNYGQNARAIAVPFVIVKTNAETGEVMKGVEFTLYTQSNQTTPLISGTTNEDGELDFGYKLAEGNYVVKETKIPGFNNPDVSFTLHRDSIKTTGIFAGKQVVEITNEPEGGLACSAFELTVNDIDGNPITAGSKVTLVSTSTGSSTEHTVTNGKVTLTPAEVKAGHYDVVYEGDTLDTIEVTYTGQCEAEVQPAPKCDHFTIVVEDAQGIRTNIEKLTLKQGATVVAEVTPNAAGKFVFDSNKQDPTNGVKPGQYTVYEGNQYLGEVTLTYKEECGYEFIVLEAPTCPTFELTIRDVDGELVADNTEVTIKDENGQVIATERTVDGKVELQDLEPGTYTVEDENGVEIGEFSSNINCRGEVQQKPACPQFTVELKDDNDVLVPASQSVVIKDKLGNTIPTTIDADGRITFVSEDVPAGMYDVYDNKVYLGEIEVSYKQTCQTKLQIAPACPEFTLTINNAYGQPRAGVKVTITGEDGVDVEENGSTEFTTNSQGQIVISNSIIKPGKYVVKENGQTIIGTITVGNTCEAIIQPPRPVTPPNPDNPTPDPEPGNPGPNNPDPNNPKPNEPGPNNPDPNNPEPNEPGPNNPDPNNPKPNEPGPNNPDPNNPEPNEPVDPNNPDPNNPEPNEPVDPNNPNPNESVNPNNPDPSNPANPTPRPNNPSASGNGDVTVQDVISQGQQLPAFDPSNATNQALKAYQDFLNNYNKLSKEDQAKVAQAIDINKIKADAERLESLLRSKGKLPQTDEANQTALVVVGLLLVIGAVLLMRRRQTKA
ncbi:collagen binding domain-containing protein [Lysinibacillus sp. FSL K6-0232]|uniref:collagen binding domain-containing protein n=1 Tax=Lysinibacillus sp. FSL K6-0232 TaxID=2921425 RepID=UPI0030F7E568